jgi:hypothetical protein
MYYRNHGSLRCHCPLGVDGVAARHPSHENQRSPFGTDVPAPAGSVQEHPTTKNCTSLPDLIGRHPPVEHCGQSDMAHVQTRPQGRTKTDVNYFLCGEVGTEWVAEPWRANKRSKTTSILLAPKKQSIYLLMLLAHEIA